MEKPQKKSQILLDSSVDLSYIRLNPKPRESILCLGNESTGIEEALGRDFEAGSTTISLTAQFFNVFNNDAYDSHETLNVPAGDSYYPDAYVLPRRLSLRLGLKF